MHDMTSTVTKTKKVQKVSKQENTLWLKQTNKRVTINILWLVTECVTGLLLGRENNVIIFITTLNWHHMGTIFGHGQMYNRTKPTNHHGLEIHWGFPA